MSWFTIYWQHGDKSMIQGDTIDSAFTSAGYGAGAVSAVDWYDNGISNTHWYDKKKKEWVKYQSVKIHIDDFLKLDKNEIINLTRTHHEITVECDNKNILSFLQTFGCFYLNQKSCWVEYISVAFGEYCQGSYSENDIDHPEVCHYLMSGTEYYAPVNVKHAVEALMLRSKNQSREQSELFSMSIEEINNLAVEQYIE